MDRAAYASMSAQEGEHWWFVARRAILASLIERHVPPARELRVLEAGCGTGGNLAMLSRYGKLDAFEYDAEARAIATSRGVVEARAGALPGGIGFGETCYDLIALFDVLEHVDEDQASLAALGLRLASEGHLLVTVPAMPWLWSEHDEVHHHKRRYTEEGLREVAAAAGLHVAASGYFNSLLFPLALAQRAAHRLMQSHAPLDSRPVAPVNAMLRHVFAFERHLLGGVRFPFGLSLYAVLTKA